MPENRKRKSFEQSQKYGRNSKIKNHEKWSSDAVLERFTRKINPWITDSCCEPLKNQWAGSSDFRRLRKFAPKSLMFFTYTNTMGWNFKKWKNCVFILKNEKTCCFQFAEPVFEWKQRHWFLLWTAGSIYSTEDFTGSHLKDIKRFPTGKSEFTRTSFFPYDVLKRTGKQHRIKKNKMSLLPYIVGLRLEEPHALKASRGYGRSDAVL